MWTRLAVRSMEPSRMPSTLSSRAISGSGRLRAFVLHGRGARDDAEVAILGERGDEFVGHAVGEIVLGRIAGEIVERKDGDRLNVHVGLGGKEKTAQAVGFQETRIRRRVASTPAIATGNPRRAGFLVGEVGCAIEPSAATPAGAPVPVAFAGTVTPEQRSGSPCR